MQMGNTNIQPAAKSVHTSQAPSSYLSTPPPQSSSYHTIQQLKTPSGPTEATNMPVFKCPPKSEPLWKGWDQKAQKNGLRHQVYAVNGDHYVGEWKDNTKHGKGTQVWKKNGAIYEGDWKFGKRDGYGTLSLPEKGSRKYQRVYSGWWKEDKKSVSVVPSMPWVEVGLIPAECERASV
ncbi:Hypothetical predicted protein [Marmota monax]|uniref:MORN repeat-containing protein 3 n=1 Tax=Marmota monax TaxID=9995 RepID=A0A5E4ASY7_MARMO|nr:Hypothetical predicted protein [Marmota monax]